MFVNIRLSLAMVRSSSRSTPTTAPPAPSRAPLLQLQLGRVAAPAPRRVGPNEEYNDALVYEVHPKSDLTGELHGTFHFALATGRDKDNRIPPKGFRIAEAAARISVPVANGTDAPACILPKSTPAATTR